MHTNIVITRQKSPFYQSSKEYIITSMFEDDLMCEVNCENTQEESLLGNIYIGKVKNIVENLNAAFIQISKDQICYYSLDECHHPIYVHKSKKKKLAVGDELLVQVVKEAVKTKDPVVTTNLTFSGNYVILSTENTTIGVSNKLNAAEKKRLKELFAPLKSEEYGFIVRTNARHASEEELSAEAAYLIEEYKNLTQTAVHQTCFSCIRHTEPQYLQQIRSAYSDTLKQIQTDDAEIYETIRAYLEKENPNLLPKLIFYEDSMLSLSALKNIRGNLESALKERVWLKSGANLVIQPTEALTVIDVNSGKNIVKKNPQENFKRINLEAAKEIAHQLRLRNISGICIVDFIDLEGKDAQQELIHFLIQELKKDPVPTTFVEMTKLGLVEITRKKVRKSLYEQLKA
ncbi:MAG: ribonuclease E/G [Lachnospiraceae bacterium]